MPKSKLKILGVIGDPISHSLSPLMQNAALAHLRLPYLYMPFRVKPHELESFFKSLPKRNIVGLNVTVPHKQTVIPFMHSLSREARMIGAVNTIVIKNKKFYGHNTDGTGYLASLEQEHGFDIRNKPVIVLGTGGAARAICVSLGLKKARAVHIANRTAKKAYDLASELNKKFPDTAFSASSFEDMDPVIWPLSEVLINATSMGMKGKKLYPFPLKKLPHKALVSDIVYTPLVTALLKQATKLKLKTHPGWGLLLHQGALSFQKWTRKKAPIEVMKKVLFEALK